MTTPKWVRLTGHSINQNSPTILSGFAVAGVIATAYLTAKAALASAKRIDASTIERARANDEAYDELLKLTSREKVELCWKLYIPATATGLATAACIIGANQIGMRRNAALVGAYSLADTAFRQYKEEVLNQIGSVKERKITDEVARKQIEEDPMSKSQVIITGGGDQLCYDSLTGRYFKSDIEAIRQAANEINRRLISDMYASHNEFYALLGLGPTTIGDELGWNLDNFIELVFSSHLADDGRPCLAVGYSRLPRADYGKF